MRAVCAQICLCWDLAASPHRHPEHRETLRKLAVAFESHVRPSGIFFSICTAGAL